MASKTDALLETIARRQRLASMGIWSHRFLLGTMILYTIALIAARLGGLIPDVFHPLTVALVPLVALTAAVILHARPGRFEAAATADHTLSTDDLFLTAAQLEKAPGEYKPLVREHAEAKASQVDPRKVVPLDMWKEFFVMAGLLAVIALATWLLPGWDPFGLAAGRQQVAQQKQQLEQKKTETQKKIESLKNKPLEAANSKKVETALAELKKTLDEMQKDKPQQNQQKLAEQQKQVGAEWRKASEDHLKRNEGSTGSQRFGAADAQKMQQWQKQMADGSAQDLREQMRQIAQLAEEARGAGTEAERQQMQKEMAEKLNDLMDFAERHAGSTGLEQALRDAMQQLKDAGDPQMAREALDALRQQMELAGLEADQLAQQMRDMKALEDALRAIQLARQANTGQQGLDGQQLSQAGNIQDYVDLLNQMAQQGLLDPDQLAQAGECPECHGTGHTPGDNPGQGQQQGGGSQPGGEGIQPGQGQGQGQSSQPGGHGQGPSGGAGGAPCPHCQGSGKAKGLAGAARLPGQGGAFGGPGQGRGGVAPEDPSAGGNFVTEKSESALQAGKHLLSWKTKEVAPRGEARANYADAVQSVRQGVSEAILTERVPPGYHDDIRRYFDSLPADGAAGSADPAEPSDPTAPQP